MDSMLFKLSNPDPRATYSPGDTIGGSCFVGMSDDIAARVSRIDIVLRGRIEIQLHRELAPNEPLQDYPGNCVARLFEQRQTACTFSSPPSGDADMYSFLFMFPAVASSSGLFRNTEQHRLPSSTTHRFTETQFRAWKGKIRVFYELESQLLNLQGVCLRRNAVEVTFRSSCLESMRDPCPQAVCRPLSITSHHLRSANEHAKSTKTMRLLRLTKSPVANMDIVVEVASNATRGDPLPIWIGVDYHTDTSTTSELPEVRLQDLRLQYREVIQLSENVTVGTKSQPYLTHSNSWVRLSERPSKDKRSPILITERTDLRLHLSSDVLTVKGCTIDLPLFRRSYDNLSVHATIVCARGTHILDFNFDHELYILPRYAPDTARLYGSSPGTELHAQSPLPPLADSNMRLELGHEADVLEAHSRPRYELSHSMKPLGAPQAQPLAELP